MKLKPAFAHRLNSLLGEVKQAETVAHVSGRAQKVLGYILALADADEIGLATACTYTETCEEITTERLRVLREAAERRYRDKGN